MEQLKLKFKNQYHYNCIKNNRILKDKSDKWIEKPIHCKVQNTEIKEAKIKGDASVSWVRRISIGIMSIVPKLINQI